MATSTSPTRLRFCFHVLRASAASLPPNHATPSCSLPGTTVGRKLVSTFQVLCHVKSCLYATRILLLVLVRPTVNSLLPFPPSRTTCNLIYHRSYITRAAMPRTPGKKRTCPSRGAKQARPKSKPSRALFRPVGTRGHTKPYRRVSQGARVQEQPPNSRLHLNAHRLQQPAAPADQLCYCLLFAYTGACIVQTACCCSSLP